MRSAIVLGSCLVTLASLVSCGDAPGSIFDGGKGNDATVDPWDGGPSAMYSDFGDPIYAGNAPSSSGQMFGGPDAGVTGGGPCIAEPEIDSLYPHNWLRPRFHWTPSSGENLFELRVHAPNQTKDLIVYTTETMWTMPKDMWDLVRNHSNDMPWTLTIRGGVYDGAKLASIASGSSGTIGVAPVDAPGTIVYWYTAGYSSTLGLEGFAIGDETVVSALAPNQVQEQSVQCIGCHVGTPDGNGVVVTLSPQANGQNASWGNGLANIETGDGGAPGAVPSYAGSAGLAALLQGPLGMSTISKAHWQSGDRVVIASDNPDLQWIDLEATNATQARGTIARVGTQAAGPSAGAPSFSHDGKTIVYTATNHEVDGRLGGYVYDADDPGSLADLYTVPYNNRAGGQISPVQGASDPLYQEYYPAYAPDDSMIAFNRVANDKNMYNQPNAEIFVVPANGGAATRLAANDPPACSGKASPGVTNSWPKWSPSVETASGGRTFYWIVFSSTRIGTLPQLFITPVVVTNGTVQTYGALYLWNQPSTTGNHTPAWEYFKVPPPSPPH